MVNLVYFTGGWLTQFTPTMDDVVQEGVAWMLAAAGGEVQVGECTGTEGMAVGTEGMAAAITGNDEDPLLEGEEEEECCLPIRIFSTVKLDTSLAGDLETVVGGVSTTLSTNCFSESSITLSSISSS